MKREGNIIDRGTKRDDSQSERVVRSRTLPRGIPRVERLVVSLFVSNGPSSIFNPSQLVLSLFSIVKTLFANRKIIKPPK